MAPRVPFRLPLSAACLPALLLVACGSADPGAADALLEQALEANARQRAAAGPRPRPDAERTLMLETDAGLYVSTAGPDLSLPPGFPGDVALPADARILTATRLDGAWSLVLHSPRSLGQVFDEFRGAQRGAGWRLALQRADAPVHVASFDKDRQHLEANFVAEPRGGTTVSLTVGPGAG